MIQKLYNIIQGVLEQRQNILQGDFQLFLVYN